MYIEKNAKLFSIQDAVKILTKNGNGFINPIADAIYGWTALLAVKGGNEGEEFHIIQKDRKAAILFIEKKEFSKSSRFITEELFDEIFVVYN